MQVFECVGLMALIFEKQRLQSCNQEIVIIGLVPMISGGSAWGLRSSEQVRGRQLPLLSSLIPDSLGS